MRRLRIVTVLAFASGLARADGLLYVGAGITRDSLRTANHEIFNHDFDTTSWKVMAGFRPISLFAVEADYIDLGSQTNNGFFSFSTDSTHLRYKAFAGYAVGFVPIPVPYLDVFGKVGLARWEVSGGDTSTDYDISTGTLLSRSFLSLSDKGTQFAWGVGAQVHAGNIGGRLEYEHFNISNTVNGASVVSLSVFLNLF
jgi:hypothetical protein